MNKSTGKDMHRMFSGATMKHRAAIAIVAASCALATACDEGNGGQQRMLLEQTRKELKKTQMDLTDTRKELKGLKKTLLFTLLGAAGIGTVIYICKQNGDDDKQNNTTPQQIDRQEARMLQATQSYTGENSYFHEEPHFRNDTANRDDTIQAEPRAYVSGRIIQHKKNSRNHDDV